MWQEGGSWTYILGTDAIGRDILSRLIFGARYSLLIGAVVVSHRAHRRRYPRPHRRLFSRLVDTVIMRVMDIILAFPSLLLALVLVAVIGPGLFNAMLAIAVVLQPHFARLTRASVIAEKNKEYVARRGLQAPGTSA